MSDAARLASIVFSAKQPGAKYTSVFATAEQIASIEEMRNTAIVEAAFSAAVSYAEAISGLSNGSISWSIVRLYYTCFYCIRSILLINEIIPFNQGGEYLLDMQTAQFIKGGASSHIWNWDALRKIQRMKTAWCLSQDSQEAYNRLRIHRDNVNYSHHFTDPDMHRCLISDGSDIGKRFRTYRDDVPFFYAYLENHLALAYPTKMLFHIGSELKRKSIDLPENNISHIRRIWKLKDRFPLI